MMENQIFLDIGDTAGLSGEERVTQYLSLLDTPEALQQVQDLRQVPFPDRKKNYLIVPNYQ